MATSISEAMEKAAREYVQRHQTPPPASLAPASLVRTVEEWSRDDAVHVDPPITTTKENDVHNSTHTAPTIASAPPLPTPIAPPAAPVEKTLTQTLFEYIRDNPGRTRMQLIDDLNKLHGFKRGSLSSLIGQMEVQRLVYRDYNSGAIFASRHDFVPLKSGAVREALAQAHRLELQSRDPKRAASFAKMAKTRRKRRTQALLEAAAPQAPADNTEQHRAEVKTKRLASLALAREAMAEKRKKADRERKRAQRRLQKAGALLNNTAPPAPAPAPASAPIEKIVRSALGETPTGLRGMSSDDIVNGMSITQAREVFSKLSEFFAGK